MRLLKFKYLLFLILFIAACKKHCKNVCYNCVRNTQSAEMCSNNIAGGSVSLEYLKENREQSGYTCSSQYSTEDFSVSSDEKEAIKHIEEFGYDCE